MMPRPDRLRPERKDGRMQSIPRMAHRAAGTGGEPLPARTPRAPPSGGFSGDAPPERPSPGLSSRARGVGRRRFRRPRGVVAASIIAARSSPHRDITNCPHRRCIARCLFTVGMAQAETEAGRRGVEGDGERGTGGGKGRGVKEVLKRGTVSKPLLEGP